MDKLRFTFKKEIKRQGDRKPEYKEKFWFECTDYCGMITELRIDSCQHAICIVYAKKMLTLGFESKYSHTDWECRIRGVYGEENLFTFAVEIPPNPSSAFLSKVRASVSAMMFIFNDNIAFATLPDDDVPQKLAAMKLSDVKCYGGDNKSRAVVLHLNKKVYSVKSSQPEAILKALDHVSGRRLLHESEVHDDILSEMGTNEYGMCNTRAEGNLNDSSVLGSGGVGAGYTGNETYKLVMGTGVQNDESPPNLNLSAAAANATASLKQNQIQHQQFRNAMQLKQQPFTSSPNNTVIPLFNLENTITSDNVTNTLSSNGSNNANNLTFNPPQMNKALGSAKGSHSAMDFNGLTPLKTSDLFLNNNASFGQPSPSGSYASSFAQNGTCCDEPDRSGGGANFSHQQNQMSAFYEQDTQLQISVNLPPNSAHYQQANNHANHSYQSSQISASGCSSNGTHTNSVFSSPREQVDYIADDSGNLLQGSRFGEPPKRVAPAVPVRRPPVPPKRSPYGGGDLTGRQNEDSFYSAVPCERYASVNTLRFVRRLKISDFICEQCSMRRWLSCPEISSRISETSARKSACTVLKCRNKHIADDLSRNESRYMYLSRVPWRKWGSEVNQSDMHRTTQKMRLGQRPRSNDQSQGHYYSHVPIMGNGDYPSLSSAIIGGGAATSYPGNKLGSIPATTSASASTATGDSSHVYGAYSGSGSIELEGVDGVSIVVSSHDSTPLYDDIITCNNNNGPQIPSTAEQHNTQPPRPGTAPNLNNNNATSWKNVSPPFAHQNTKKSNASANQKQHHQGSSRYSRTPPPNPLNLQFKHQTTMDPQGNLRGHLYINLDYPTQTPIVTTTTSGNHHSYSSSSPQIASNLSANGESQRINDGHRSREGGSEKKFSAPFMTSQTGGVPASSRRSQASAADSSVRHHSREKGKISKTSIASSAAASQMINGSSNYSHLSTVQNSVKSQTDKSCSREESATKPKISRQNKPSCDLYQNLEPAFANQSVNTSAQFNSADSGAPTVRPRQQPDSSTSLAQSDARSDLKVATSAWNPEKVSSRQSRQNQLHASSSNSALSRQQCVNRWIDNAVELSNYSRDNSPDTFMATTASISDSRDDVFLTDNEQQFNNYGRNQASHQSLSLQQQQRGFNSIVSPPQPPPPRQKTHNYHNIDPFLNINHKHCPEAEQVFKRSEVDSTIMSDNTFTSRHAQKIPTASQNRGPWQDITPPRRPVKHPSSSSSKAHLQQSPRRVGSNKPPLAASSRRNFYVLSEREHQQATDNYRSINFNPGSADSIAAADRALGNYHEGQNMGMGGDQHKMNHGYGAHIDFSHKSSMGMHAQSNLYTGGHENNSQHHKTRFQNTFNSQSHNVSAMGRSKSETRQNNQIKAVNYTMIDANPAPNVIGNQKLSQVSKAEKALVQYSIVDGQQTKALHDAGKEHITNRNNINSRRRFSGKSSGPLERQPSVTSGSTHGKGTSNIR